MRNHFHHIIPWFLIILMLAGCSAVPVNHATEHYPPIMTLEELSRPYIKLGRIKIIREVNWSDYSFRPDLQEWAQNALREEAYKMGADAVILPEITSRQLTVVILPAFPATEYRATGVAIKFK